MKNSVFNEVMLSKALAFKHGSSDIPDQFLDHKDAPVKQVCAKLSIELSDNIDNVCAILGMSKRSFIELALINAISEYESIASEYDIFSTHVSEDADNA